MFSVVCVPFIAYHYAADNWMIGSITCKLSQYLTYVTTYVTVYTLVAVAIVRVCKVTLSTGRSRDERHQSLSFTAGRIRHVTIVVGALWVIALAANLPIIFSYRIKTYVTSVNASDGEPYNYCGIEDETQGWRIVITFFVLAYVAPLTVITSMYLTLLRHLRRQARHSSISVTDIHHHHHHHPHHHHHHRHHHQSFLSAAAAAASQSIAVARTSTSVVSRRASHVTRVLVVVVVVFAACWLPLHIHLLVAYCGVQPAQRWYEVYRVMAHCLAYANSCMNPLIYSYVSSEFRRRFSDVILTSQSCRCQPSTADSQGDQPEMPIMPMRNASYEAIALEQRSNTPSQCIELQNDSIDRDDDL